MKRIIRIIHHNKNLGLLLLRLAVGTVFIQHGVDKFVNIDQTMELFRSLGMNPLLAYFVGSVETLSGIALVIGLFSTQAALLLSVIMMVVIFKAKAGQFFIGGYELEFTLLFANLAIATSGPGKYALAKSDVREASEINII